MNDLCTECLFSGQPMDTQSYLESGFNTYIWYSRSRIVSLVYLASSSPTPLLQHCVRMRSMPELKVVNVLHTRLYSICQHTPSLQITAQSHHPTPLDRRWSKGRQGSIQPTSLATPHPTAIPGFDTAIWSGLSGNMNNTWPHPQLSLPHWGWPFEGCG